MALAQQQIVASSFGASQQSILSSVLRTLPLNVPFQVLHEPTDHAKVVLASIKAIHDGKDACGEFNLAMARLHSYTQRVLKATLQVPVGYVTFYGSLAKTVGGGPRAVGNVMANNPYAPIVPCHRVVKTDFTLGGYGFGLKAKVAILKREKRGFPNQIMVPVNGRTLDVYPVECVLRNVA